MDEIAEGSVTTGLLRNAELPRAAAATLEETFLEFTFEAAHQTPPYSSLHGHSFHVTVFLRGPAHPVFGWSHDLTQVEAEIREVKHRIDHRYLNDIEGLETPTLENLAKWLWHELDARIPGFDRVLVRRGCAGQAEGCVYARQPALPPAPGSSGPLPQQPACPSLLTRHGLPAPAIACPEGIPS